MRCIPRSSLVCGRRVLALIAVLGGVGQLGVAQAADQEAAEAAPAMSATAQAVSDIGLAQELIEYGRKAKSPEALLTAALILHRTPTEVAKESLAGELPPAADPAGLLAEAKKLRPDDKALAELIAQAQDSLKEKSRGSTTGPRQLGGTLNPGALATTGGTFKAKEVAMIRVQAMPVISPPRPFQPAPSVTPPVVKLVVTNAQNQVVGQQVGAAGQVQYVPRVTGPLKITVANAGRGTVRFTLIHN